ncbi:phosphopantetheine-binding protein, partial [Streptomyces sp. NPDC060000]|uniref:phosphopantetheine-binding protein n=1 Tax=Streptomyces sp. NPDC060000 TaxID=3347031 RepID=UPI0036A898A2
WVRQVRCPVRFADAVGVLSGEGVTGCVEVGPDAVLTPMAEPAAAEGTRLVALQRRDRTSVQALLTGLGELWTAGTPVDWNALFALHGGQAADLPTYAFQHRPYWLDQVAGASVVGRTAEAFWAAARAGDAGAAAEALHLPAESSLADIVAALAAGAAAPAPGEPAASGAPENTAEPAALLKERFAKAPDGERHALVLEVVRAEAAAVLALGSAEELDPREELLDLGFSSLMAVELRNHLGAVTGIPVPPTLVYDYPSAYDVATFLCDALAA